MGSLKYVVTVVLFSVALVASLAFGGWAFSSQQDYKNNADKKAAQAVAAAKETQKAELQKQFDEESKKPYTTFKGPLTYGGVSFTYPKTWSVYVDDSDSAQPINGYFHPGIVPSVQGKTAYALRFELLAQDFNSVASAHDQDIINGDVKAIVYIPPKMANVPNVQPGLKLDGLIRADIKGSMVIIKVRDKTLQVSTESDNFLKDFNETVLANLTFVP